MKTFTVGFFCDIEPTSKNCKLGMWRWDEGVQDFNQFGIKWFVIVEAKDKFEAIEIAKKMFEAGVPSGENAKAA